MPLPGPVPTDPVRPGAALPDTVLLWDADEVADPPPEPCCLAGTAPGDRAVVYRTGPGGGVTALFAFTGPAEPHPGGRHAAGVVVPVGRPVPRAELLADPVLAPVFRHLRGRRRLPPDAARRLVALLAG
ncbi:hypothetical protein GCM10009772_01430 [Pseudonocardia alni subsp. carboxydivorans]|uniref:Uncharacterized protein n=1 Tax=Pseudonocardia alni subsp. carboxydivorans TaxID=415010 RepID=A0ABU9AI00_PSEA5